MGLSLASLDARRRFTQLTPELSSAWRAAIIMQQGRGLDGVTRFLYF